MTHKEKKALNDAYENLNELDKLLTERVGDLHEVKGGKQARHAYIFYRKLVWDAKHKLEKFLRLSEESKTELQSRL